MTMRTSCIILAAALTLGSGKLANAETVYIGNVFIDAVAPTSGTCAQTFVKGDFLRAVYRPKSAGDNGADSHLSLTGTRSNIVLRVPGNNFAGNVNYVAQSIGSSLARSSYGGGILQWTQSASADTIAIEGSLAKFFNISPCTITIRGNLIKR